MRKRHVVAAAVGMFAALALSTFFGEDVEKFSTVPTPKPLMTVSPQTMPTCAYDGKGYPSLDPVTQIIQQNPDCWIGIPGATCEPGTRTFIGQ